MANVNPEIWGQPSSWVYTNISYGLESTVAKLANADKPKCRNFGATSYDKFEQTLFSAVTHNIISLNTPLDRSLCPCGIAPEVSPWAKLAIFNESNNLSTTPSRTIEINNANTNWFFCNFRGGSETNAYTFNRYYSYSNDGGLRYQQFSPNAATTNPIYNQCLRVAPWLKYGIKSVLLTIQVRCIAHNSNNPITGTFWTTLDNWKNNYPTYDICGLRFFVRACSAINSTTLALTYSNDDTGDKSGQIAVIQDIVVNNNGADVETEFLNLSISRQGNKDGYIFDVTPMIYNWSNGTDGRTNRAIFPCWNYFTGQTINIYKPTSDPQAYYFYKIPYSDDTYSKIMKIAACFGCFFTPTNKYQFDYDMLDTDLYLTVLDENGVAHGQYTHGADNANNSLYSKGSIREIDYNPDAPPTPTDPNNYSVTTGFNTVGNVATTTKAYVINGDGINGLSNELWTIIDNLLVNPTDVENLYNLSLDTFLTNNPIDAIVSVKKFPLSSVPHGDDPENVYLGKVRTGAAAYPLAMQQARYNFTSIPIFPKFGNCFLDYAPYTKMQLYVPFCGTVDIDAADFMGRNLSVEMVIDFITGTVTAYVLANELVVTSLTGTCAIDIPITGTEQATVNSAYESAAISERQSRGNWIMERVGLVAHPVKTLTKPLTSVAKDVSTQLTQAQSTYELTHINIPLRQIGNASPLNSWALEFVCRLIIYYPDGECITFNATNEPSLITDKVESFGAVNGFATVETNTLSSFTGFTQVSDVDLSGVSATDTEKEMILSLLQSGVYL